MVPWLSTVLTAVISVLASSGFWTYWMKKHEDKSARTKLLVGLAHDRIIQSGRFYLDRGWISVDEYENLYDYLYRPYKELGGNGAAERVMSQLKNMPHSPPTEKGENDASP